MKKSRFERSPSTSNSLVQIYNRQSFLICDAREGPRPRTETVMIGKLTTTIRIRRCRAVVCQSEFMVWKIKRSRKVWLCRLHCRRCKFRTYPQSINAMIKSPKPWFPVAARFDQHAESQSVWSLLLVLLLSHIHQPY